MAQTLTDPNTETGVQSPLEAFRAALRGVTEFMRVRGVDPMDTGNFDNQVSERELIAEIAQVFDAEDASMLGEVARLVIENATNDEAMGQGVAMRRATQHPYECEIDKLVATRGLSRLAAMRAARAENPQTFARYRKSRFVAKRDGGGGTAMDRGESRHDLGKHAYERKIEEIVSKQKVTRLVAMRMARAEFPKLFEDYRKARRVGKAS